MRSCHYGAHRARNRTFISQLNGYYDKPLNSRCKSLFGAFTAITSKSDGQPLESHILLYRLGHIHRIWYWVIHIKYIYIRLHRCPPCARRKSLASISSESDKWNCHTVGKVKWSERGWILVQKVNAKVTLLTVHQCDHSPLVQPSSNARVSTKSLSFHDLIQG
jgi:hypothetical protein